MPSGCHKGSQTLTQLETLEQRIAKLERQNARLRELYDSAIALVQKHQEEREYFLARVHGALLGTTNAGLEYRRGVEHVRSVEGKTHE